MKAIIVLLITAGASVAIAQVAFLDAPFPNGVSHKGSGSGDRGLLQVSVAISELPDQSYALGEPFEYELELTNQGQTTLVIPWTVDAEWSEATSEQRLEASVALTLANEVGEEQRVGATYMYGTNAQPRQLTLLMQ